MFIKQRGFRILETQFPLSQSPKGRKKVFISCLQYTPAIRNEFPATAGQSYEQTFASSKPDRDWFLLQISSSGRSIPSPTPTGGARPSILSPPRSVVAWRNPLHRYRNCNLLDKVLKVRLIRQDLSLAPSYRQERLCGATQSMPLVGRLCCSRCADLAVKGRLVTMDPLIRHFSTVPNTEPTGRKLQSCGYSGQRKLPYSNRFTEVARLAARYTDSPGA
ncbi:hypothetical protein GQ607_015970 [Colletotrichum asianum]|uniref:Uncharacterized protein n=1 Tax=Colletotrichum asianum TaxID=702518 RepID=A0A8H3VWL7_9PEZI|nr:hypothetical protein GQ607_015970 [Colletotrichum asianum]